MVDDIIVKFLKSHHVLTLATAIDGEPYCSNAFYCYDSKKNIFIFSSDMTTRHAQEMVENSRVAASIVLETRIIGKIEGIQISGLVSQADGAAKLKYIKRFPYTALMELTLWIIEPELMKLTANKLGFGKKLIWKR